MVIVSTYTQLNISVIVTIYCVVSTGAAVVLGEFGFVKVAEGDHE